MADAMPASRNKRMKPVTAKLTTPPTAAEWISRLPPHELAREIDLRLTVAGGQRCEVPRGVPVDDGESPFPDLHQRERTDCGSTERVPNRKRSGLIRALTERMDASTPAISSPARPRHQCATGTNR